MPYDNLVDLVWERGVAAAVIQFAYFVVVSRKPSANKHSPLIPLKVPLCAFRPLLDAFPTHRSTR